MNKGVGNTSKGKQHDVDCTSKGFISEGSQSLTKDVSFEIHTNNINLLTIIWYRFEDNNFFNHKGKGKYKVGW